MPLCPDEDMRPLKKSATVLFAVNYSFIAQS